jgi:CheY-like chemotaxis protein
MDGIETVRIIRNGIDSKYAKTIPIIALTANALIGNEAMFLKNGFQAFLSKPIDILRLDHILRQWVRDKKKEKALPPVQAPEKTAEETGAPDTFSMPGITVKDALVRFNNDKETYLRILASYAAHTPAFIETARSATRDLLIYRVAVHSIKGSSRGIGAEGIGSMAEQLEHAARDGDTAFVEANTAAFIEAVQQLIATVTDFLDGVQDKLPPPK